MLSTQPRLPTPETAPRVRRKAGTETGSRAPRQGKGSAARRADRLLEVALGAGVAAIVSLLVLPERVYGLGLDAAAHILDLLKLPSSLCA